MNNPQGLPSIIGAGVLVSVLWTGNQAMSIPGQLDTLTNNQTLILYRLEQLEKK